MSAVHPKRASLESLTPALVGIGLLHVLGAAVLSILLPILVSDKPLSNQGLVWRSPQDFVGQKVRKEQAVLAVAAVKEPAKPEETPQGAQSTVLGTSSRIQFKPASAVGTSAQPSILKLSASPPASPAKAETAPQTPVQTPPPQNRLALLEKTADLNSLNQLTQVRQPAPPPSGGAEPPQAPAAPPAPQEAPPAPSPPPQTTSPGSGGVNKYITLSALVEAPPSPPAKALSLLDIAKLNELERQQQASLHESGLDAVESSLQRELMRAWQPPASTLVPANQRRVSVELSILRDGSVKDAVLKLPSGSDLLDNSVRTALTRVTKIPESLPASFKKERYAIRVNLQIE